MQQAHTARHSHQLSLLYVALVAGLVTGATAASAVGLDAARVVLALVVLVPVAFAGARLWYALARPESFRPRRDLRTLLRPSRGGLTLMGALPATLLASVPITRALGLSFAPFWDAATLALLVALVPLRLRCYLHGCCAGRRSSHRLARFARGPSGLGKRVPVQIFEASLCVVLALLLASSRGALPAGAVTLFAAGLYGAGRFVLDAYRAEEASTWWHLRSGQWLALALVVVSVTLLVGTWSGPVGSPVSDVALQLQVAALALLPAALVALPITLLLRFVACGLILDLDPPDEEPPPDPPDPPDPPEPIEYTYITTIDETFPPYEPGPEVTFECRVPLARDTGPITIQMESISVYSTGEEINRGRVDLPLATTTATTEQYRTTTNLSMTDYRVICHLFDTGVEILTAECTGTLTGPGLRVVFRVPAGMAALENVFCFA